MKQYVLILLTVYFASVTLLHADSVEATVNTKEVIKGNPVQLRIKAIGKSAAFPHINEINGIEVTSAGTSRQSHMKITASGMKSETSTVKKYVFVPEHDMVIPSYTVRVGEENYKTKPITIKVVESKAPKVQRDGKFDFKLKTEKSSVSVGESFVVTLYISIVDRLKGIQISDYVAPTASDFFIKEMGGQKEYVHSGYTVIEKQYILTSKKEGNFTISPAAAKLGQPDWTRQDIFGRPGVSWMPIASNALNIEVKTLNTDADLIGKFTLDTMLDRHTVKANQPVNLTVKIRGKGNLEDYEFPKYEIDGVTVYSDEAKIESHLEESDLVSSYSKSFAFIAEDDFHIPAREITVFDPETQETKTLFIDAFNVSIEGQKTMRQPVVSSNVTTPLAEKIVEKEVRVKSVDWWMLTLAFLIGAVVMYLFQLVLKLLRAKKKKHKDAEALNILYAHISEDVKVEEMVRKLYAKKNGDKSVVIDKKELKEMIERFS